MKTIDYEKYYDKVLGGWTGKCIGGIIGAKQENNKNILNYTIDNVFPDKTPPNDDFDLQILYLQEVLEKKGSHFTSRDIADAFATKNKCWANEYRIAIKNIESGIYPPYSGVYNNDYFKSSMGCPIRSEIWGFATPGNGNVAARFCEMDGSVDHGKESINGEIFFATMESEAFFEDDVFKIIKKGQSFIESDSELYRCVDECVKLYKSGLSWKETRNKLVSKFGSADASYSVINIGFTVLALLFGEGDYTKTLLTAVNCGYDTDCTAATAGAILGLIQGESKTPEFWKEKVGNEFFVGTVDIVRERNKLTQLAEDTAKVALSFIRDGVISLEITNVPENIKPYLPQIKKKKLELKVDYLGSPSIAKNDEKIVCITAKNISDERVCTSIDIEPPNGFSAIYNKEISIDPQEEEKIEVCCKSGDLVLGKNLFKVNVLDEQIVFGFSSAKEIELIGPFWNNFDTQKYENDPYKGLMQFDENGNHDLFAMFNGFVNIDYPYVPNENEINEDGEKCVFYDDKLNLDEKIGYKGPCCVYLKQKINYYPEKEEIVLMFVGNNAPFKIWVDGEFVHQDKRYLMSAPQNNIFIVPLKKGENNLVIKLIRQDEFKFSYFFSKIEGCVLPLFEL